MGNLKLIYSQIEHIAKILIAMTNNDPLPLINDFLIISTAFGASFASLTSIAKEVDTHDIVSVSLILVGICKELE